LPSAASDWPRMEALGYPLHVVVELGVSTVLRALALPA
jgi:hypothetical protein